jgi:hypothetical protein
MASGKELAELQLGKKLLLNGRDGFVAAALAASQTWTLGR